MTTLADRYIRITPYQYNTRDYRRYSVTHRYFNGLTMEATWIGGGHHTTYDLVERLPDPKCSSFNIDGRLISASCRSLAEVRQAAYAWAQSEAERRIPARKSA